MPTNRIEKDDLVANTITFTQADGQLFDVIPETWSFNGPYLTWRQQRISRTKHFKIMQWPNGDEGSFSFSSSGVGPLPFYELVPNQGRWSLKENKPPAIDQTPLLDFFSTLEGFDPAFDNTLFYWVTIGSNIGPNPIAVELKDCPGMCQGHVNPFKFPTTINSDVITVL